MRLPAPEKLGAVLSSYVGIQKQNRNMCKLAIVTKHDSTQLGSIIINAWREMSRTEKDGFGAAWVRPNGKIGYVKSSQATFLTELPSFCDTFSEGTELRSDGGALIIHGRTATCGVNVVNTHPMLSTGCALVHNGVVSSSRFHNTDTTCDSELLLHAWKEDGIDAVAQDISGYYAFAIIQRIKGRTVLDVVRDDRAQLKVGKVDGGWAFATTPELLKTLGSSALSDYKTNTHVSFVDGKEYSVASFVPAKADKKLEKAAAKALGGHNMYTSYKEPSTNWRASAAFANQRDAVELGYINE